MASQFAYYGAMGAGQAALMGGKGAKHLTTDVVMPVTRMCFGKLTAPPGGWYGPFGFLRIVGIVFLLIFIYSCASFTLHMISGSSTSFLEILLMVSSLLCALCALSHEQLMKMTTLTAKENKRMAKSLDQLEVSIDGLKGVKDELEQLLQKFNVSLDQVDALFAKLAHYIDLDHVCDLLRDFMMADAAFGGNKDSVVDGADLLEFLEQAHVALRRVPGLERTEILAVSEKYEEMGSKTGIDIGMAKLLCNAMITNNSEPERAESIRDLFLFCLEPQNPERKDIVMSHRKLYAHTISSGGLAKELKRLQLQTGYNGPVKSSLLQPLLQVFCFAPLADTHIPGAAPPKLSQRGYGPHGTITVGAENV
jgi:hypothetical protein